MITILIHSTRVYLAQEQRMMPLILSGLRVFHSLSPATENETSKKMNAFALTVSLLCTTLTYHQASCIISNSHQLSSSYMMYCRQVLKLHYNVQKNVSFIQAHFSHKYCESLIIMAISCTCTSIMSLEV